MVKRTGTQLRGLKALIIALGKTQVPIWRRVAEDLEKPSRIRREVNLYKLNKTVKEGEVAVVPGKVLSLGEITKPITVAAYRFSAEAKEKINKKGKAISIAELLKQNPKGNKVRIMG
jgi:large subunit ribosomal protein L18e